MSSPPTSILEKSWNSRLNQESPNEHASGLAKAHAIVVFVVASNGGGKSGGGGLEPPFLLLLGWLVWRTRRVLERRGRNHQDR
jgi:hypothetical protein